MKKVILLVEDNPHIMKVNRETLEEEGYQVIEGRTGAEAMEQIQTRKLDLIVLDIMLPDDSGIELCRKIRQMKGYDRIPIIFLSAKKKSREIVEGLKAGGDDYLPKPYSLDVFLAKIEALLRRTELCQPKTGGDETIYIGPLTIRPVEGTVIYQGEQLLLTKKEFTLFLLLLRGEGQIIEKELLYEKIWGTHMGADSGALWAVVSRLKRKLSPAEEWIRIESVRPQGYRLVRSKY